MRAGPFVWRERTLGSSPSTATAGRSTGSWRDQHRGRTVYPL